jgi:hypothetical protein
MTPVLVKPGKNRGNEHPLLWRRLLGTLPDHLIGSLTGGGDDEFVP